MSSTMGTSAVIFGLLSLGFTQEPDAKRWEKTIASFEMQDKKSPPPKDAILFTGSSSIALWRDLAQAFPDFPVINRGFGGSTTPEVNDYVERIVLPYKPRIVVLYSGSNDLASKRTPEQVLADFQTFVKKVHTALPDTKVFYISIHTPPGRTKLRESNQRTNKLVAEECAKDPKFTFVDVHELMLAKDGQPNLELYRDALHPNAKGYELWKNRLTPLFREKYQFAVAQQPPAQDKQPQKKGKGKQPAYQPTADEKQQLQSKLDELKKLVSVLKLRNAKEADRLADVEVHAVAVQRLFEFPEDIFAKADVGRALTVLDRGLERAKQLRDGKASWLSDKGRIILGYDSALDGSVQPYLLSVPPSYDGKRPVPLYVWLHGRNAQLTEASFIAGSPGSPQKGNMAAADLGQMQLEVFGRGNNAYHWAGEVDVFEAIAAVQKRFQIDPKRIVLRGFSLGGAGAWHLALHHPDRWVAAEIGAGTWPRRYQLMADFPAYQQPTLRIWENIPEWALNGFNLPIAGHDGDNDNQIASIPGPPAGSPTRGQLESSIRVREQLVKEGFPSEGEPLSLSAKGTPDIFLISEKTGHSVNAEVRRRLDAFLKEWVTRGQTSPDHIRFLTYTTRYNKSYWVELKGLQKHYERAEIDAQRLAGGKEYRITTNNVTRLVLRETGQAATVQIDGQALNLTAAPEIALEKTGTGWRVADVKWPGLHKTHGLQGPIDDAFLDPFLLVRPTGTSWNAAVNQAALKTLERFDRAFARNYRAHPRVKDDKDVTPDDLARYNVVLFGDPGSNKWLGEIQAQLPIQWTPKTLTFAGRDYASAEHMPVMVYPNPLNPARYVVVNSGLTISEREYNSDYSMPRLGDFAILKLAAGDLSPEVADAGFFDESWQVPKK